MRAKIAAILLLAVFMLSLPFSGSGQAQELTETPRPPGLQQTPSISVSPANAAQTGQPGAVVFYQVVVTNTGTTAVSLTVPDPESLNPWPSSVNPQSFSLDPGQQTTVVVSIAVPGSSANGEMNLTTVLFLEGGTELGRSSLTTTAQRPEPTAPGRPLIVLDSYGVSGDSEITPGTQFELRLTVVNRGQAYARNVVLTFGGTDFLPVDTGGVRALNEVDPGEKVNVFQPMFASTALSGSRVGTVTVNVAYTNLEGDESFTETLTVTINLKQPQSSGGPARPTATPTTVNRPQLVVSSYRADIDPLQPGTIFNLELDVRNLGTAGARSVTMVLGGGVVTNDAGTPVPGGSELSTFAPLGSSNLVFLGDIPTNATVSSTQRLIVNVTANPGAYAFKLSFVYDDEKGARHVTDQVITMLIYQLPQLEIGYYRDPGAFYTNQPNMLPLQVTNLGRKTAVLGNMRVTSLNAEVTNNVTLVGALEPGGYFTLDPMVMPYAGGPLDMEVTVSYTDDFNQPRVVSQVVSVDVMEIPTPEFPDPNGGIPPDGGFPLPTTEETVWQKVVRFFKGLIGLDSAPPSNSEPIPFDGKPMEEPVTVPVRPKG